MHSIVYELLSHLRDEGGCSLVGWNTLYIKSFHTVLKRPHNIAFKPIQRKICEKFRFYTFIRFYASMSCTDHTEYIFLLFAVFSIYKQIHNFLTVLRKKFLGQKRRKGKNRLKRQLKTTHIKRVLEICENSKHLR